MQSYSTLLLAGLAASAAAYDVPTNVQTLYDSIVKAGSCTKKLATGFYSTDDGPNTSSYCGDHLEDDQIIYLQGTSGALVNMDIDCDGLQNGPGSDGRCGSSGDTQDQTSFMDTVAGYGQGVKDLNAYVHPYVVFGNVGSKAGYTNFDPTKNGVEPLSIMAVVCGGKLYYGVYGDENGDDGPKAMVGEASISMATFCFGDSMNGNSGHDGNDVLYIAFTGKDAVPGKTAKWDATSATEFESSIQALGDKLVSRIGGGGAVSTSNSTDPVVSSSAPTGTKVATTLKTVAKTKGSVKTSEGVKSSGTMKTATGVKIQPPKNTGSLAAATTSSANFEAPIETANSAATSSADLEAPIEAASSAETSSVDSEAPIETASSAATSSVDSETGSVATSSATISMPTSSLNSTSSETCSWMGHCAGATCTDENDCDGDLVCNSGTCGPDSSSTDDTDSTDNANTTDTTDGTDGSDDTGNTDDSE